MAETQAAHACPVEGCGRSFSRTNGLTRHMAQQHGLERPKRQTGRSNVETPPVDPDSVAMQVKTQLRELTLPLREQLAEIDKRLLALNREASDLREAKRQIDSVVSRLEGTPTKAAAGIEATTAKGFDKKMAATEQYLLDHSGELAGGFTGNSLAETMKAHGVTPAASPDMMRRIISTLHERGIVRLDRVTRGGGNSYLIVQRNGGGPNAVQSERQ